MYEDLRNAVELLKNYCADRDDCVGCPLDYAICGNNVTPAFYSLLRFDNNVKKITESKE